MSAELRSNPEIVIREVVQDVWIFSAPFNRFGLIPFGGRSVAIKLDDGSVWVMASTPLSKETKETLDKLGPVKWIVAGDAEHHLFLGQYKSAYPEAKLIGVEGLDKKEISLKFDGAYGVDPADTKYGFETDIEAIYFSGFANKDVAFYHIDSKSLITADLLFNLPGKEAYSKSKRSSKVPVFGKLDPYGSIVPKMLFNLGKDKEQMKADLKIVKEQWDFTRIIMAHGDVIDEAAKSAWRRGYEKYGV